MESHEKWEIGFTLFVIILFAIVAIATLPDVSQVGGVPSSTSIVKAFPKDKVIDVNLVQEQYVFNITETGAVNSSFMGSPYYYNLIVAHPGDVLNITMTAAKGADTANLYIPYYSGRVVDDQIVPGLTAYDGFPVPNTTGVYAFADGEYDGPWFSYQVGEILVIPTTGYFSQTEIQNYINLQDQASTGALVGDPYSPPIVNLAGQSNPSISMKEDNYGVLSYNTTGPSVPASTFIVSNGSQVTLTLTFPTPNSDHNYLQTYVNGQPTPLNNVTVGVYGVTNQGQIVQVSQQTIKYDQPMKFEFNATYPAYIYGIASPVFNTYDPNHESNLLTGEDFGLIMGAWGAILVEG